MSCTFSREELALYVEGDLSGTAAQIAASHLATCDECLRFFEQLQARQSLLKSLRRETVRACDCTDMRREVMSIIEDRRNQAGWALRLERAIVLGSRRRAYALATFALLGVVSVSVLAQIRHASTDTKPAVALFEGRDTLLRPEGYRDWIFVGPSTGPAPASDDHRAAGATHSPARSVYINPFGYGEYVKTGVFPDGTLMVWESPNPDPERAGRPHHQSPVLLASVKDSTRFEGGWGFFDFTGSGGSVTGKARALLDASGCRACHRQDAETDHVFTQFYPELRAARQGAQLRLSEGRARLTAFSELSWLSVFPGPPRAAHA